MTLTRFDHCAAQALTRAQALGHDVEPWHRGTDHEGRTKWIAGCQTCGALLLVEYVGRTEIAYAGNAARRGCQTCLRTKMARQQR